MGSNKRSDIQPGAVVKVVQKHDQRTGKRTKGTVKDLLTKSPTHPHGIKVRHFGYRLEIIYGSHNVGAQRKADQPGAIAEQGL